MECAVGKKDKTSTFERPWSWHMRLRRAVRCSIKQTKYSMDWNPKERSSRKNKNANTITKKPNATTDPDDDTTMSASEDTQWRTRDLTNWLTLLKYDLCITEWRRQRRLHRLIIIQSLVGKVRRNSTIKRLRESHVRFLRNMTSPTTFCNSKDVNCFVKIFNNIVV